MNALTLLSAFVFVLCNAPACLAQARAPRQAVAAWTNRPPVVDGSLDDPAWRGAKELAGFAVLNTSGRPQALTRVRVLTDGKSLFVGFRCAEPYMDRIKATKRERDDGPWLDDSVEVIIDPDNQRERLFHFIANTERSIYDAVAGVDGPDHSTDDKSWNGDWKVAVSKGRNEWCAEWRIPFELIGVSADKTPCLGVNFARGRVGARVEVSSWSPSRWQFANPACLGELILPAADGSYCSVQFPVLDRVCRGRQDFSVTIANHGRAAIRAKHFCALSGASGAKFASESYPIPARGTQRLPLWMEFSGPGSYKLTFRLEDARTGRTLYQLARGFVVRPEFAVAEDLHRLYHGKAAADIELNIEPSKLRSAEIEIRLLAGDSRQPLQVRKLKSPFPQTVHAEFDLSGRPKAIYLIEAELRTGSNVTASAKSRPMPYDPEPEVGFTENGFLRVNGKPYFPVGIYTIQSKTRDHDTCLAEAREAGFNTTCYYAWKLPDIKVLLDAAARNGIRAFVYPTAPFSVRKDEMTRERVVEDIRARVDHPALLGWYLVDEPEGIGKGSVEQVRDLYQWVKETDTRHPCSLVVMSPDAAKRYGACADIVWIDPYPVPHKPVTYVSECVGGAVSAVESPKPVWAVPQGFDWNVWRTGKVDQVHRPTPEEERCMTYLALVHGAKGILFWAHTASKYYIHDYPDHWAAVKRIAGELRDLTPVLLASNSKRKLRVMPAGAPIDTMVKELDQEVYVFAVNHDPQGCRGNFSLSEGSAVTQAEVLFEDRAVAVSNGRWEDEFKPLAVHVYRLSPASSETGKSGGTG